MGKYIKNKAGAPAKYTPDELLEALEKVIDTFEQDVPVLTKEYICYTLGVGRNYFTQLDKDAYEEAINKYDLAPSIDVSMKGFAGEIKEGMAVRYMAAHGGWTERTENKNINENIIVGDIDDDEDEEDGE